VIVFFLRDSVGLTMYQTRSFTRSPSAAFAGAEGGSRVLQFVFNPFCERVRAPEHAPRDPY
tara:strand:- start:1044 stop:1226 length:183 start_codon:yes stop_codon:yes gene_type:complete